MLYLTLLSLHIIFVVTWFAALFYLPRLFVYHSESSDRVSIDRFVLMERRLYRGILLPSSLLALLFGVWLIALNWESYAGGWWFWVKILLVVLLFGYQGMAGALRRRLAGDESKFTAKFFRIFNEVPLIFLVAIVFLVVFKPA